MQRNLFKKVVLLFLCINIFLVVNGENTYEVGSLTTSSTIDTTLKAYYVKPDRNGTGDGTSWDNAMSGSDFVQVLPKSADSATFYISEGNYDISVLQSGKKISINKSVTIIGGYPKKATATSKSEPSNYRTNFNNGYLFISNGVNVGIDGICFAENEGMDTCAIYVSYGTKWNTLTIVNSVIKSHGQKSALFISPYCRTRLVNDTLMGECTNVVDASSASDTLFVTNCYIAGATNSGVQSRVTIVMRNCTVADNAKYGVSVEMQSSTSALFEGNTIQRNGVGIYCLGDANKTTFKDNVIISNSGHGISIASAVATFTGNYIGTDKEYRNLGNGGDGIHYESRSEATFPTSLATANYVGYNTGNGISYNPKMAGGNVNYNYIGVTPQGNPMPNEGYGIYLYGSSRLSEGAIGNRIGYNAKGGVYVLSNSSGDKISQNLFFGTKNNAIGFESSTGRKSPVITSVERDSTSYIVSGTTDTISSATIELFYSNGDPQTAHKYLGSGSTNIDGDFTIKVPFDTVAKYGKKLCFTATAVYYKNTSALSEFFCCENCGCHIDTTYVTDTIMAGETFFHKTYTQVGRHDGIYDTLTAQNGCDSIISHILIVKPSADVKSYYVKTQREGKGDGSSWINAMNGEDFANYLPLAPEGTTFYVAEGTYSPQYGANLAVPTIMAGRRYEVNSRVTIRGGYPATAQGDELSEPDRYITLFSGDIDGDLQPDLNNIIKINADLTVDGIDFKHSKISGVDTVAALVVYAGLQCNHCDFDSCATAVSLCGAVSYTCSFDSCSFRRSTSSAIYQQNQHSVLSVTNSEFISNSIIYPSTNKGYQGAAIYQVEAYAYIEKCNFANNSVSMNTSPYSGGGAIFANGYMKVSDCIFRANGAPYGGAIWMYDVDTCVVDGCFFEANAATSNGGAIYSIIRSTTGGYKQISNCTFISNAAMKGGSIFENANNDVIVNNTFFNNDPAFSISSSRTFLGNIVIEKNVGTVASSNVNLNLVLDSTNLNNSIVISSDQLSAVFLGNQEDIFYPVITYQGGFTPTVALKTDKLPDGTSLRFPLSLTSVNVDQRDEKRLKKTCVGAYEIGCSADTVYQYDTIQVGTIFYEKTYDKVGDFETFVDTTDSLGCIHVIAHEIYVTPSLQENGYYVKMQREGTGDGTSWANAMNGSDFAYVLPRAVSNASFYIAEGTYQPVYTKNGTVSDSYDKVFYSEKLVNIYGGFSPKAKQDAVADPSLYHTVFSGDVNQNSVFDASNPYAETSKDDLHNILFLTPSEKGKLTISGIEFRATYSHARGDFGALVVRSSSQTKVDISDCQFSQSSYGLNLTDCSCALSNCQIYDNYSYGCVVSSSHTNDSVTISKCSFWNNGTPLSVNEMNCKMVNTTFANNSMSILLSSGTDRTMQCEGVNNTILCNVSLNGPVSCQWIGSIIDGTIAKSSQSKFSSVYSVYTDTTLSSQLSSTDQIVTAEALSTILDHTEEGYQIKNNGGVTPTVSLVKDVFADGKSIRFPLSKTSLTEDQRGVQRLESTCRGAYEIDRDVTTTSAYVASVLYDTICSGEEYANENWYQVVSELPLSGDYYEEHVIGSSIVCDTVEALSLHILPSPSIELTQTSISPTICPDEPYGTLSFTLETSSDAIWNVILTSEQDDELMNQTISESPFFHSEKSLRPGSYRLEVISDATCSQMLSSKFTVKNMPTLRVEGEDTLVTLCRKESQASTDLIVYGYDPSMSFYLDNQLLKYPNSDSKAYIIEDAGSDTVTIHVNGLAPGEHLITANDYCSNTYELKKIIVLAPDTLQLTLNDHSTMPLTCSKDQLGFVELGVKGGFEPQLVIQSDHRNETLALADRSNIRLLDCPIGDYRFTLRSSVDNCTDESVVDFTVEGPRPLTLDLISDAYGKLCEDGSSIVAKAEGESENYTFTWTYPAGEKIVSSSNVLKNVGPGIYLCTVTDEKECSKVTKPVQLSLDKELSRLVIHQIKQSATCFSVDAAKVSVHYSDNNQQQAVTCLLNDAETGKLVQSVTSKAEDGDLILEKVPVGTYHLSVRYGTANCVLDSTKYADTTIVIRENSTPLSIVEPVVKPQTCISSPNGSVTIEVQGWSDYQAYWNNSTAVPQNLLDSVAFFQFNQLEGGKYVFEVKDACEGTDSVVISNSELPKLQPFAMSFDRVLDTVRCAKATTGQIGLNLEGGDSKHGILTLNGQPLTYSPDTLLKNLGKGTYTFEYQSADSTCTSDYTSASIYIKGPDTLSVDFSLTGIDCPSAKLMIDAHGETSPYVYTWQTDEIEPVITTKNVMPFPVEATKSYTLTVSDKAGCDSYTTTFRVPSEEELPPLLIETTGMPEKCYQGNNGSMIVYFSMGDKKLPYGMAITATVTKGKRVYGTYESSIKDESVVAIPIYNVFEPGDYEVTVAYGSGDCVMQTNSASDSANVEALHKLSFDSENLVVTPKTCTQNNGTASITIDGWNDSHTVLLIHKVKMFMFNLNLPIKNIRPVSIDGQMATLQTTKLGKGTYCFKVIDACGNSATSKSFTIEYKPTQINSVQTDSLRCISLPNGSLSYQVIGWTSDHTSMICRDDNLGNNDTIFAQPSQLLGDTAYFIYDSLKAGNWNITVQNECDELIHQSAEIEGVSNYEIKIDYANSKLKLDCPYSEDGIINLTTQGGAYPSFFTVGRRSYQKVEKIRYVDSTYQTTQQVPVITMKYDSTRFEVYCDTTINGAKKDTSINCHTEYERMVDEQTGEYVYDTLYVSKEVTVTEPVMVRESIDSLVIDTLDPIAISDAFIEDGKYLFENCAFGSYTLVYGASDPTCPDKTEQIVELQRPEQVYLLHQTLDVSCSSSEDGTVSLKPQRGNSQLMFNHNYVAKHNDDADYSINHLYQYNEDEEETAAGNKKTYDFKPYSVNGKQTYRIDSFVDPDFIATSWSYKPIKSDAWTSIDVQFPHHADSTEQFYYDADDALISGPVYSNFALDNFWVDNEGTFSQADVQTLANLAPGTYAVQLTDSNNCVYHDTLNINYPPNKLEIESVEFDEKNAECDPSKRQILVNVKGGWGQYIYSFTEVNETESMGKLSDGYRGGEAAYYNAASQSGWGVSPLLHPGEYTIYVIDANGCIIQSEQTYSVKTKFELQSDSIQSICPRDPLTTTELYFVGSVPAGTFDVVEFVSPCSIDTLDDCRDYTLDTLLTNKQPDELDGKYGFKVDLSTKQHGLFVYETTEDHCGTYVEASVIDTLTEMKLSQKIGNSRTLCYGESNADISLFINGGTAPYTIIRNSAWAVDDTIQLNDETMVYEVPQPMETFETTIHMNDVDTVLVSYYTTIKGLSAGSYALTVADANGCKRPMGDTATYDTAIVLKNAKPLSVDFVASSVCPDESVTEGGNVYFNRAMGGTAPYRYFYLELSDDKNDSLVSIDSCETASSIQSIEDAKKGTKVYMALTDANNCVMDTIVTFQDDEINVENIDFWASTWRHEGDVLALIDACAPNEILDSVVYTFYDEFGNVDSRVEQLDKRMLIYDIENGKDEFKNALYECEDTKNEVSDAYFKNHFNLLIDNELAKHINFIRINDTSDSWLNTNHTDSTWSQHNVKMTAYFKGCAYELETRELKIAYDDVTLYEGGISPREEIISLNITPNPYTSLSDTKIKITFSEQTDADLYLYHMDGTTSVHHSISKLSESGWTPGNEYDDPVYTLDVYDLLEQNGLSDVFSKTEVIVVFVKTNRDAKSTHMLYSSK